MGACGKGVFAANGDKAVRPEAVVELRVVVMAVGYDD
jgi:hypothetical protein